VHELTETSERTAARRPPAATGGGDRPLADLQSAVGNAALSRMLDARRRTTGESPHRVDGDTQGAIDAVRDTGASLEGPLRTEMEQVVGGELEGVRIHAGASTDALSRRLGARGFTQGRDVFLRSDRLPTSEGGRATLAHELQHVVDGAPPAGAVLREEEEVIDDVDREEFGWELGAELEQRGKLPEAQVVMHEAKRPTFRPTVPDPNTPDVAQTFDIKLGIDHGEHVIVGVNTEQAMAALNHEWRVLHDLVDTYHQWHRELLQNRENHKIVGFWADKLGHGDPPDIGMWTLIGRKELSEAAQVTQMPQAQVEAGFEKRWQAHEAAEKERIDQGLGGLDKFAGGPENARLNARDEYDAARVSDAANKIQRAANRIEIRRQRVFYYKEGQEKGAQRGIAGTKVVIGVLAAGASAGVGEMVEGGLVIKAGATGLTQGGLGAFSEAATQTGEMFYGDREWGNFDVGAIKRAGIRETINGFTGALMAGKLTQLVNAKAAQWVVPFLEDAGINLNNEGLQFMTKFARDWMIGLATSPASSALNVAEDIVLDKKPPPKDWGEFFDRVNDEFKRNAVVGAVMVGVGHSLQPTFGTAPAGGGSGRGAPPPPPEGGGGGSSGTGGTPPVDPYARTVEVPAQQPPSVQRGNAAIGSARTLRPGELEAQTGTTASIPAVEPPVDPHGRTAEVPARRDVQRGNAPIGSARTLQPGEVAVQTGDTAPVPAPVDPHAPTGEQDVGTAPTRPQPAAPVEETTTHAAVPAPAEVGPPPPLPPAGANHVIPVRDIVTASQLLAGESRANRTSRLLNDNETVESAWHGEYGQDGPPPPAWVDADGRLVVDTTRVRPALLSKDILSGPIQPFAAPVEGRPPGAPTGSTGAGGASGPAAPGSPPPAGPPTPSGPVTGPSGPVTGQSGPVTGQTGPQTGQTGAQPVPEGEGSQSGAGEADRPRPSRNNPAGPREFVPYEAVYRTDDAYEAAQLFYEAYAAGRQYRILGTQAQVAEAWRIMSGGETAPPVGWLDSYGNAFVDATRMEGLLTGEAPPGPIQNQGYDPRPPEVLVDEPDLPPYDYPNVQAGQVRGVLQVFDDPVVAAQLFLEQSMARRFVRFINDRRYLVYAWEKEYGGAGDPPLAWTDADGYLVVDAERVPLPFVPDNLP
jgi:hypothetical protein